MICSSCLQFKSRHYCKPIDGLSKEKVRKYVVKFCILLKNRSAGQFVCNLCLRDINKNRTPKRSKINIFKFSQFPPSFIQELKKQCQFQKSPLKSMAEGSDKICDQSVMQLNRLESFLIPFIRVAYCPVNGTNTSRYTT